MERKLRLFPSVGGPVLLCDALTFLSAAEDGGRSLAPTGRERQSVLQSHSEAYGGESIMLFGGVL